MPRSWVPNAAAIAIVLGAPAVARAATHLPALPKLSHSGVAVSGWTAVDRQPGNPAFGFGSVWVPSSGSGTLDRVDPKSLRVIARIRSASVSATAQNQYFDSVAVSGSAVWHASDLGNSVSRIDPRTNRVIAKVAVGGRPDEIAAGPAGAYVGLFNTPTIERIGPAANTIVRRARLHGFVQGIALGAGKVWALESAGPSVVELDPVTLAVRKRLSIASKLPFIGGYFSSWWISADAKTVCAGNQQENAVSVIDPVAGKLLAQIALPFGRQPFSVAADRGRCWVTNGRGVFLVDPHKTAASFSHLPALGASAFTGVAAGGGGAWVTLAGRDALVRVK